MLIADLLEPPAKASQADDEIGQAAWTVRVLVLVAQRRVGGPTANIDEDQEDTRRGEEAGDRLHHYERSNHNASELRRQNRPRRESTPQAPTLKGRNLHEHE